MTPKKLSTTVYLTVDQAAALKALTERTRVPSAVYIREGIDAVLAKYATKENADEQA